MATKRQTRLQSRKQAEENAPPPPITTLISQYELLTSLCQHLSSADIIHLGATSKERWQYLMGSPRLLKALIGNSSCDGRGIAAQARIFGYWDYKPERATRKCRGKDAQPCYDCGAMTCRFHIEYPSRGPYSHHATATAWADALDQEDQEFWDDEWAMREQEVSGLFTDGTAAGSKVETVKSHYMLCSMMIIPHCEDCQPLLFLDEKCKCTPYGLLSKIWRCIPCTLRKETKCAILEKKDNGRCICGKSEADHGAFTCGFCGKLDGWRTDDQDGATMRRVHAQLGTMLDGRAGDPTLSQLG